MKIKDYKVDGYNIHVLKTDKFKQIKILVEFVSYDNVKSLYFAPLLINILKRTSSQYNSLNQKNLALYKLYAPSCSVNYNIAGSYLCFGLNLTFLNEKYTEKGMNEKTIDFAFNILFNPKIENKSFDEKTLEIIKEEIIHELEAKKENPRSYIGPYLSENLPISKYKLPSLKETIAQIKNIDGQTLYKYYQYLLKKSRLEIFITGDVSEDIISQITSRIPYNPKTVDISSPYIIQTKRPKLKVIKEKIPDNQSLLNIGLVGLNLNYFESNYVLRIYSSILGGGTESLLNKEAREEKSLCYSISTARCDFNSTIRIFSAFDKENYNQMIEIINRKLEDMRQGNFEDNLIDEYKQSYIASFYDSEDFIGVCTEDMKGEVLYGDVPNREKIKNMRKVTKEDVVALARKIHIATIIYLEGERKND